MKKDEKMKRWKKMKKMKKPDHQTRYWEALWGSTPRGYQTSTYHCKVLVRPKCCLNLFFFSHVNTIVTSPEIGNHLSLSPGILWTSDFKWCCFLSPLHTDAGDAAEWTEWSCLSPSPRELSARDSDGRASSWRAFSNYKSRQEAWKKKSCFIEVQIRFFFPFQLKGYSFYMISYIVYVIDKTEWLWHIKTFIFHDTINAIHIF